MSYKNDGGAAFPVSAQMPDGYGGFQPETYYGMTLRDWFAGQALAGMADHHDWHGEDGAEVRAQDAYIVADAMLKAREQ